MSQALQELLDLLDLEQIEENIFRGSSRSAVVPRVFGGQVAAQALVAAGRTVPEDRPAHSLHAYFLRPGDPGAPIVYTVDRIRDGRSFTTRRVVAVQHGKPIFHLSASFQTYEEGLDHQEPMPASPDPETLPTSEERLRGYAHLDPEVVDRFLEARAAVDLRYVDEPPYGRFGEPREPHSQVWFRTNGKLADDPLLHVCLATYVSDMTLLDSVLLAHGRGGWAVGDVVGALENERTYERCLANISGGRAYDERTKADEAAAIVNALKNPGHAIVLVPLRPLLAQGGVLDRLRGQGFTVKTPGED